MAYRTATNGTWEKLAEARENRSLVCHFTKSQVKILLKNIANSVFIYFNFQYILEHFQPFLEETVDQ